MSRLHNVSLSRDTSQATLAVSKCPQLVPLTHLRQVFWPVARKVLQIRKNSKKLDNSKIDSKQSPSILAAYDRNRKGAVSQLSLELTTINEEKFTRVRA